MIDFPLRTDEYSRNFYIIQNGEFQLIPYLVGDYCSHNISFSVLEEKQEYILKISITVSSCEDIFLDCFGFRLGIDSYMDSYPQWNRKFFPAALRCEKSGFWSCFMSPEGKMLHNFQGRRIINRYRKGFTIICHYFLQWGELYLSYDTSQFPRASKKHQFS